MASIFTSQTPAVPDAVEPGGIAVGTAFTPAEDGTVTHVRFYGSTTVTGTWTGGVFLPTADDDPEGTGTGTLLGSGTFVGTPVAGDWNLIELTPPVAVTAGVTYKAVYHNTEGHYVATPSFPEFASGGLTNGSLTAPANGINSILQGTFRVGGMLQYPSNGVVGCYFADVVVEFAAPTGTASVGLVFTVDAVGDAPGIPASQGSADLDLAIVLAATASTPMDGSGAAALGLVFTVNAEGLAELRRAIAPSEGSRFVYAIGAGLTRNVLARPETAVTIYAAGAGSSLADIRTIDGEAIAGSVLTTDEWAMLPLFRMPPGVDTVYAQVADGPRWPVYAREDDRLDRVESGVSALQGQVRELEAEVVPGLSADVDQLQEDVTANTNTIGQFLSSSLGTVRSGRGVTGSRPSATTAGAGSMWYDTTLGQPIWSDGAVWTDATGSPV